MIRAHASITVMFLFCLASLDAASLTWPSGNVGHWLGAGEWSHATFGASDYAYVNTGTVNLTSGNVLATTGRLYFGNTAGSNSLILLSGANLSADRYFIGQAGTAVVTATSSNLNVSTVFSLAVDIGSQGNLNLTNSSLLMTGSNKFIKVGVGGNGTLSLNASTMTGFTTVILGSDLGSEGTFHLNNGSNVQANAGIEVGSGGTGNMTIDAATIQGVDGINKELKVGASAGSYGTLTMSNNAIAIGFRALIVGNSGNGTLIMTSGANVSTIRNLTAGSDSGTTGIIQMTASSIWSDGGSFDVTLGNSGNSLTTMVNSRLVSGRSLYIGQNTGSEGHLAMSNDSTIIVGTAIYVGNNGSGNLTVDHSNITIPSNLTLGAASTTTGSSNFIFNSGNITVNNQFRTETNDALIRLGGGAANLTVAGRVFNSTTHTWEHLIDKNEGRYDQMGLFYIETQGTVPDGHLKIGIKGGAVFSSNNSFYLQVGASNGSLSYESLPANMYDAPTLISNINGTTKDAVQTVLSAGNHLATLDITDFSNITTLASSSAAGWLSVANIDPTVQRLGVNVYFELASGTASDVVSKLVAAGYAAETTTFESYSLKFKVPATALTAGTRYVIFDFRDIGTGVAYATVNKVMVVPVVSGATFYVQ